MINPGVTVANGFPPHRLFNSTRFACAADGASGRILGPQNCAYASPEFAARAAPASRRAAWESAETALLGGAASGVQHAVLMGHMPVVSVQQRQSPLQADALAMLARLPASAAPQIALSGHDHVRDQGGGCERRSAFFNSSSLSPPHPCPQVLAHLVHPSAPSTEFFISGAGGITSAGATGVAGSPADGAARAGDEWMAALVNATYAPYPPPRGVAASNPDVGLARFYTERNGFLLCSANSSALSCGFFSIDCTDVPTSGACAPSALGPLHTRTFAARPVAPTPAV